MKELVTYIVTDRKLKLDLGNHVNETIRFKCLLFTRRSSWNLIDRALLEDYGSPDWPTEQY